MFTFTSTINSSQNELYLDQHTTYFAGGTTDRAQAKDYISQNASKKTLKYLPSRSLNTYWHCNTNIIFYYFFDNFNKNNPRFCGKWTKKKYVGVLDRRGPRLAVFDMILHTEVKFWTTRLASSTLRLSLLLGPKTTFHRLSGHIAWRTWLWSSSGCFCVSCPCSLRLFRRGLRCWLPSLSLWTATSRSLYPPVARSVSSRPWGKMRPWKLNTRLDIYMFCLV